MFFCVEFDFSSVYYSPSQRIAFKITHIASYWYKSDMGVVYYLSMFTSVCMCDSLYILIISCIKLYIIDIRICGANAEYCRANVEIERWWPSSSNYDDIFQNSKILCMMYHYVCVSISIVFPSFWKHKNLTSHFIFCLSIRMNLTLMCK